MAKKDDDLNTSSYSKGMKATVILITVGLLVSGAGITISNLTTEPEVDPNSVPVELTQEQFEQEIGLGEG